MKKNSPTLILTALRFESRIIFENFKTRLLRSKDNLKLYQIEDRDIFLLETGMGIRISEESFARCLKRIQPALLFNFGIAGALSPELSLLSTVRVNTVCSPDRPALKSGLREKQPILNAIPEASLLTVDEPVLTASEREQLLEKYGCDLVDMETYHLARIAKTRKIPLISVKIVSDYANENTLDCVRNLKTDLQTELKIFVLPLIREVSNS